MLLGLEPALVAVLDDLENRRANELQPYIPDSLFRHRALESLIGGDRFSAFEIFQRGAYFSNQYRSVGRLFGRPGLFRFGLLRCALFGFGGRTRMSSRVCTLMFSLHLRSLPESSGADL